MGEKVSGICRAAKTAGEIFKTCLVPYSHGFILELSVNIRYAYVHVDYEQSLCFLIVRRERSEKNRLRESWPHESWSSFRAAYFFRSALDGL